MSRILVALLAVGLCCIATEVSGESLSLRERSFFDIRVKPVLTERCISCHGPGKAQGDLRLHTRADLLKGGGRGPAIVPGDPEASLLVRAVRQIGDVTMPPNDQLEAKAISDLAEWVARGAKWPEESAQLEAPAPPPEQDAAPASSAILTHKPDAEEEVMARVDVPRVTFDIAPGEPVSFNEHIRPILSNKCFACHGPDAETRKAGLRLDLEAAAFEALPSGHHALVAGDLKKSQLLHRIAAEDPDDLMPPASFKKPVTQEEADLLARWVMQGAEWEQHWSFEEPVRATPPQVADAWQDRVENPIDSFVLKKVAEKGLEPSPEADRRTLIRRLSLDLTGLPPTLEEVEAFLADERPDAYGRAVDRLLASPRYGEHMARYWLDAARYADTNGYHIDNERYMWRWRDWVIDAYNANKPFDEFTVEQLAGDLLPDATLDQRIASGFNRNHMINFEGGIIPEEYRVAYVVDRVNTTSTVWMGLTMDCARCHDHKYDPISQKEFYSFYAYFNNVNEKGSDGIDGNATPLIPAPLESQAAEKAKLEERVAALRDQLTAPAPEVDAQQEAWEAERWETLRDRWVTVTPEAAESLGGATLTVAEAGVVQATGENPAKDTYEVVLRPQLSEITALRLEALADDTQPNESNGRASNGNFVLSEFELEVLSATDENAAQAVTFRTVRADFSQENFPASHLIDGNQETGWASDGHHRPEDRAVIFVPDRPILLAAGTALRVRLRHASGFSGHNIGKFRLAVSGDPTLKGATFGPWHISGPFAAKDGQEAFDTVYPPEEDIDLSQTYPDGRVQWVRYENLDDNVVQPLPGDVCATYLYRTVTAPSAREMTLSLGSNDAIRVWVNGEEVHANNVQRGVEPDQDTVEIPLNQGDNDLLVKVVNYGNAHAFYFRNADESAGDIPLDVQLILARGKDARSPEQQARLRDHYRRDTVPAYQQLAADLAEKEEQLQALVAQIPTVMVMSEMEEPRETFVLNRGEYDQPTVQVTPGLPAVLPEMPEGLPNNRLGLAKWLVHPDNPLTARVVVNRYWQRLFGTGLVKTVEDFGVQGERPVNGPLLDWLAVEFVESGWDIQHMLRLMVSSATYRQQSRATPDHLDKDAPNRYLARAPRFRLDAEVVRDNALALSGLLVEEEGGPSVSPYQPEGLWEEVAYGSGFTAQEFVQGEGEELYRRSMYTFWKRQSPPPQMMVFDAPNRESCSVTRGRTNTPLQALALLNDPQFVEAARVMAQRVLAEAPADTPEARVRYAFELATARPPKPEEADVLLAVYAAEREGFAADTPAAEAFTAVGASPVPETVEDAAELAAWSTVTSIILNLDETITKS